MVRYEYNLQNRLSKVYDDVNFTPSDPTDDVLQVEYVYNPDGIRVQKVDHAASVTTDYLIDSYNHTGYAQVLEEWSGGATPDVTYTIGDDIISQYSATSGTEYLLYDGHGSTRQLVSDTIPNTTIVDDFSYDGYGVLLQDESVASANPGKAPTQDTSLLYAGEQFDTDLQQYHLRARYYDQNTGRFNRLDPFLGNRHDPQSLHKYLYCHANPVNFTDPDGYMAISIGSLITTVIICSIIIAVMVPLVYSIQRAITTRRPTPLEIQIVNQAIVQAQILVQDALSKLNRMNTVDRLEYTTWFGVHSNARHQRVVDCYTKVQTYLNTGFGWSVTNKNVFGITDIFGHISFGNLFRTAPANAGTGVPDTQPGTIIHELTHKARMTKDHEYGVFDCKRLANTKPDKAVRNADNYEYFAEVVP